MNRQHGTGRLAGGTPGQFLCLSHKQRPCAHPRALDGTPPTWHRGDMGSLGSGYCELRPVLHSSWSNLQPRARPGSLCPVRPSSDCGRPDVPVPSGAHPLAALRAQVTPTGLTRQSPDPAALVPTLSLSGVTWTPQVPVASLGGPGPPSSHSSTLSPSLRFQQGDRDPWRPGMVRQVPEPGCDCLGLTGAGARRPPETTGSPTPTQGSRLRSPSSVLPGKSWV